MAGAAAPTSTCSALCHHSTFYSSNSPKLIARYALRLPRKATAFVSRRLGLRICNVLSSPDREKRQEEAFISRFAPDEPRKGCDILVEALEREGVSDVFAYPGGASLEIHQALTRSKTIRNVLPRHEQGGIFAAEGYAPAFGLPGVCITTSGPGVTNYVSGLDDAVLDSVPIVAITGQVPRRMIGTDAFQETPIVELKYSQRVMGLILVSPLCKAPSWTEWFWNKVMSNLLYICGMCGFVKDKIILQRNGTTQFKEVPNMTLFSLTSLFIHMKCSYLVSHGIDLQDGIQKNEAESSS